MPNFSGDARVALLFVYILTRAGETADVVDNAAVTREVSCPEKLSLLVGKWRGRENTPSDHPPQHSKIPP